MSTFFQTTYRGNFIAGFDKYVDRGVFTKPAPDVYWDPKDGRWETYSATNFRFIDEGLPSSEVTFLTNAGALFDQITQQWAGLAEQKRQSTAWDGRLHKWVLAEFQGGGGAGSCREEYEKQLRYLRQLHTQGLLTDEQFNKQAQDTWERYRHCV